MLKTKLLSLKFAAIISDGSIMVGLVVVAWAWRYTRNTFTSTKSINKYKNQNTDSANDLGLNIYKNCKLMHMHNTHNMWDTETKQRHSLLAHK